MPTIRVELVDRSLMKISRKPFVSPVTRLVASETNTTYLPVAENAGERLSPLAAAPVDEVLTRVVVCAALLYTKMSMNPLVSPETRFVAADRNTTKVPSGLT